MIGIISEPVRCFSCNAVIKYQIYKKLVKSNPDVCVSDIFKTINVKRYCCRRMLLGSIDL